MTPQERTDFWTAVGEEFGEAIVPPVAFEDASIHEVNEAVSGILGAGLEPAGLVDVSDADVERLSTAFVAYFESGKPDTERLRSALARITYRWPAAP